MKKAVPYLIFLFVIIFLGFFLKCEESFTSDGTLLQLATSHVPTAEDIRERRMERKQIHHDLLDLTGRAY
jgi:hypothetical protein